ncbi:hypothetical protein OAN22_02010 [Alphaproteobacteria bacterium]|nr:hypothetical protein [Alphaproteobacteria bacterium]
MRRWGLTVMMLSVVASLWGGSPERLQKKPTCHCSVAYTKKTFQKLLKATGLKETKDLNEIILLTQGKVPGYQGWLRTGERWDKQGHEAILPFENPEITRLLQRLRLEKKKRPRRRHYPVALVLGASGPSMEMRLLYLKELLSDKKSPVKVEEVYFLTGERPLAPDLEADWMGKLEQMKRPQTETEIAQVMIDENKAFLRSHGVKEVKVISTPMLPCEGGKKMRRPNTGDTFETLKQQQAAGQPLVKSGKSILVVSNQPYVSYQREFARTYLLPQTSRIDVVGNAAAEKKPNWLLLDSLARTLYQHQQHCTVCCPDA